MKRSIVEERTILLAIVGSHAYGLNTPTSDIDIKGICIAPADYYYGIKDFYQKDKGWDDPHDPPSGKFPVLEGVTDCCIYELRKFVDLAMKNNPTILEMLWLKEYEYLSPSVGLELVANRDMFLSKRVKHTYSGYSFAQLKKVETHRRWLLNPPLAKPEAKDYGIDDGHLPFTKSEMGSFLEFIMVLVRDSIEFMEPAEALRKLLLEDIDLVALVKQKPLHRDVIPYIQQMTRGSNDYMHLLQSSQAYRTAINEWDSYQQWKKTRNPARAALEAKCGFDCYTPDTEFLTDKGWKFFDDIDTSRHLLATINISTLQIEYQEALTKTDKEYRGTIYKGSTQYTHFSVTSEHNMLVSTNGESWSLKPISGLEGAPKRKYRVLNRPNPSNYNDLPLVTDDYLRLMGCYLSEGSLLKRVNKTGPKIKGISLSQLEGGRLCPFVDAISEWPIAKYGYERKGRIECTYNIYDCNLGTRIFNDCGEYCRGKRLPTWVNLLSERQALIILDSMMAGDGTEKRHSRIYYTASKTLADSLQILCMHQGWVSKVWEYPSIFQVYIKHQAPLHGQCVFKDTDRGSIKGEPYTGRVVCFEVPNSILVTRYRGETAYHGNSKHASHSVRLLRQGLECLKYKELIVDRREAGDAEELLSIRNGDKSYEEVIGITEALFAQLEEAYVTSSLPHHVDQEAVHNLCSELVSTGIYLL